MQLHCVLTMETINVLACSFLYSSKILQYILQLHPTILPNYYTNYTNTTGTGPQGAKDNDYPVAINIEICSLCLASSLAYVHRS